MLKRIMLGAGATLVLLGTAACNDDAFLTDIASSIPGLDVDRALADRDSPEVESRLDHAEDAAAAFGIDSTPSFVLSAGGEPRPLELMSLDAEGFTAALDEALSSGQ